MPYPASAPLSTASNIGSIMAADSRRMAKDRLGAIHRQDGTFRPVTSNPSGQTRIIFTSAGGHRLSAHGQMPRWSAALRQRWTATVIAAVR